MILSNPAYDNYKRQAGRRKHALWDFDPEGHEEETLTDWLFFTNLNAHETPGRSVVLEE